MTTNFLMTVLIILCIFSVLIFCGVVVILAFLLSTSFHNILCINEKTTPIHTAANEKTPEEKDAERVAKQKFEAEMAAFQDLMNYNADVAYGINKEPNNV